jgi:hypothetical protein
MYSVGTLHDAPVTEQPEGGPPDEAGPGDADASCGDIANDPKNCGACGHDCLGQQCHSGRCDPAVLVTDQDDPRAIAVDDTRVYWGSGGAGGVNACDKKKCDPDGGTTHVSDEGSGVVAMVMTKFAVFWALGDDVKRLAKDTGDVAALGNGVISNLDALAVDDTQFWFTFGNPTGGVARCPLGGCDGTNGAEILANDYQRPAALALAPGAFVFAAGTPSRAVLYCSPSCVDPAANQALVLADNQAEPQTIAIAGTSAFFSNALAAPDDAIVRAALAAPHAPTALARIEAPGSLVLDGAYVYYIGTKDGSLHRVPKDGGADVVLALGLAAPRALAVDDSRVWVANGGPKGSIVWIAK